MNMPSYAIDARRKIREAFNSLPIFRRPRGQALYHYCAVLEVEAFKAGASLTGHFSAHRAAVESSIHAIPALFERCPSTQSEFRIDQVIFAEAHELFEFSRAYEQVEFSFELADRGQWEIHVAQQDPRITFAYASTDSDLIDTLRRSGELMERMGITPESKGDEAAIRSVVSNAQAIFEQTIRRVSADRIEYEYSAELIACVAQWARVLEAVVVWHMAPDLRLGLPSFADVRRFWGAALAISNTHDLAHLVAGGGDRHKWPIGSRAQVLPTDEWVRLLSGVSGLSTEITSTVLGWLVFNPKVCAKAPVLQPFLEVGPRSLCVPSLFLIGNNQERNFLKLLNWHPSLRQYVDTVRASKEPRALAEIAARFPEPDYRTKRQVVLPKTDADLVVYERTSGLAMVLQHKWHIGPDTLNESTSNDDELNEGVRQAVLARDYWRADLDNLRATLSLSVSAPITGIEACVICRGSGPTGFLARPEVPVLTENAFLALLARDRSLPNLWTLLNARPDLDEAAERFLDVQYTVSLAGFEFVIPGLAQ